MPGGATATPGGAASQKPVRPRGELRKLVTETTQEPAARRICLVILNATGLWDMSTADLLTWSWTISHWGP